MTTESSVAVAAQTPGSNVATSIVTRPDTTTVHRQEIVHGDPDTDAFRQRVTKYDEAVVTADQYGTVRRMQEVSYIDTHDATVQATTIKRHGAERVNLTDRRGSAGRGSTR